MAIISNKITTCKGTGPIYVNNKRLNLVNNKHLLKLEQGTTAWLDPEGLKNSMWASSCYSMFNNCTSLTTLDLSNFDTSKVTNMSYMFYYCTSLTTLDVSNFDTSKVTDMDAMFDDCSSLTTLDLSNFDTSNVTNMGYMFYNCSSLTTLDLSNFDFTKVTSYNNMFYNVPSSCLIYVKDETAKTWITSKFTNLTNVQIKGSSN